MTKKQLIETIEVLRNDAQIKGANLRELAKLVIDGQIAEALALARGIEQ